MCLHAIADVGQQPVGGLRQVVGGQVATAQFALYFVVALLFATVGCGSRTDRLEVTGEVTLDGTPLDSGSIRFSSLEGEALSASGALIQDGQFRIPREKGLRAGTYRVEITSPDVDAPPVLVRQAPGGPGIPSAPERIPPAYNVNSEQTIELTAEGDNHFVFDIVSRTGK